MTLFYIKAIEDEALGPFFVDELGPDIASQDWIEHIELLADFWLAKILGEKTYIGNFIGAHLKIPHIKKENFLVWLKLFSQTTDEVYTADVSEYFKKKAIQLSQQFLNSNLKL